MPGYGKHLRKFSIDRSCIEVLKYSETCLNWTLSKSKTCLKHTYFTVPSATCICNLNLCKPNTCLYWTHGVRFRRLYCTTKSITFGIKTIFIYLASIINFIYSIPFSIFHNTTKQTELFSLKGTTFVYVQSSDLFERCINDCFYSLFDVVVETRFLPLKIRCHMIYFCENMVSFLYAHSVPICAKNQISYSVTR